MSDHIVSAKVYVTVFLALCVLTVLTVAAAGFDFGRLNLLVALGIAVTKATLVVLYFMHARYGNRLIWVFVICGVLWLGVLLALLMSDYAGRGWTV